MKATSAETGFSLHWSCRVFPLEMKYGRQMNLSYIIKDGASGNAAIVDPSWELDKIAGKLDEIEARLTTILLTHSHFDHVNLVSPLIRAFGAQVVISGEEKDYYGFSSENLLPVRHLDQVKLGNTAISCLLTPGHTAGGMCYLLPDSIFTGDTVFIEGCGTCATAGGCPKSMFKSIQMIKRSVGAHVRVYPGHCYGSPVGCRLDLLMKENIYFQIDRQEQFVKFRMREGQKNLFDFKPL